MPKLAASRTSRKQKVFFTNLDALRFFAFFGVFISHTFRHWHLPQNNIVNKLLFVLPSLNDQSGPLGVRFFFVLSGFLITYLIFTEKEHHRQRFDLKAFYARRFLRIWPLYFITILIGFVIYPYVEKIVTGTSYHENANILNYLLFLGNFDMIWNGNPQGQPLGLLWSLAVEEQFYFFWPLIFLLKKPVKNNTVYLFVFSLLLVVSLSFQFYHRNDRWVNYFHSLSCMSSLVTGGILAYGCIYHKKLITIVKAVPTPIIYLVYLVGFTVIYTIFYFDTPAVNILYFQFLNFFFAFVILEQNIAANSFIKFGRMKMISYLGKISFGLYLLHPIGIYITDLVFSNTVFSYMGFALKFFFALGLSIGLSYISYNYFEKYFLKLKVKFENQ